MNKVDIPETPAALLMSYLGYSDGKLNLPAIADKLAGTSPPPVRLYSAQFAAHALFAYLLLSAWWGTEGLDVANDTDETAEELVQDTFASLVEMFSGSKWTHNEYTEMTILGHECSEEDGPHEVPDEWRMHNGWEVVAASGSWDMRRLGASGGALYQVGFTDEGFNYDIWLFARWNDGNEGDL